MLTVGGSIGGKDGCDPASHTHLLLAAVWDFDRR
jgi:hypothetical protein